MDKREDEFQWAQAYRPRKVSDVILPARIKKLFTEIVKTGGMPNLLLTGPAGTGKTTVAMAACDEIEADYYKINCSKEGNIATLRVDISDYASSVSFTGGRKVVILDEADYLNPNTTQPALRAFMEDHSRNCAFIMTANYPNRIIPELRSRLSVIDFKEFTQDELLQMAGEMFKRTLAILKAEGVEYDKEVVAEVINLHKPNWRKVLHELQRHSLVGKIDTGILARRRELDDLDELIEMMKGKRFTDVRRWVGEVGASDPVAVFRRLYDTCSKIITPASIPELVIIIAEYQYKAAFVADQEINLSAALANVMASVEFK
jgi:DNA polymerase III delta prime subunit